ncbi:MAG: T9SS type A sorting domain-containing protein, partial [Bacteroidota bacterium]
FDLNADLGYVNASLNPFSAETTITVESRIPGECNFEVFNILGKRVHARVVRMAVGENQIVFDGSELPSGSYFYSLGNVNGRIARPLIIAH